MMRLIILALNLAIYQTAFSNTNIDSLLHKLENDVNNRAHYTELRFQKIQLLSKTRSTPSRVKDLNYQFETACDLFNEYKSFIYDSAFNYAIKAQQIAYHINDPNKIAVSKLNLGFILASSGMFKEAFDTLSTIQISVLPDSIRREYYSLKGRAYFDLISFDMNGFYTQKYSQLINQNLDSAIRLFPKESIPYYSCLTLKYFVNENYDQAKPIFETLIHHFKLDTHQYAMFKSSLAYIYYNNGQSDKAIELLTEAVAEDIKSSTKETNAAHKLAEILFENGNFKEAHRYIKLAMEDALFYKTHLREKQISTIMPSIEDREINFIEKQRQRLFLYSMAITVLSLLVVVVLVLLYKHLKELRLAKKNLQESNKIKDEYIGYYFNILSDYIDKIDRFKKTIDRKIMTKKIDDIQTIINAIDTRKEREELFASFDKIFLKLFPDFVGQFNSLLKEDGRILLKPNQLLNTDLRIFALIRLGIIDHEKIAKMLDYSVHTIYAYKTKIKNKAIVPNEQFEQKIMEIETI